MRAVETQIEHDAEAAPLAATLLSEPPAPLAVGGGTVLYAEGLCDPRVARDSLELALGPLRAEVESERTPAVGLERRWWALLDVPADTPEGEDTLLLRGRLDGRPAAAPLAELAIVGRDPALAPPPPSVVVADRAPLIAVCMATHEPDPERLRGQLDSIRAQDWPSWICVISDDASSRRSFGALVELTADDERFVVSRSEARLGFYRNFERALRMAPIESRFVSLADQDDVWDPDKLTALHATLAAAPAARLAYGDMRIRDESGALVSDTYWILRRNRWDDITSLLVANVVTGAASLFRADLLDDALPFPPAVGEPYHDHWLAVCALAGGDLAYLDRPTYDRVRHFDSVTAATRHAQVLQAMGDGDSSSERGAVPGPATRDPAAVYRESYLQSAQFARTVQLRLGERIEPRKRRALRRFAAAGRTLGGPAWLALRSLRPLFGRNETLGRERALAAAIAWRRFRAGRRGAAHSP
jgi:O-antigen biosynthesis protein